MKSQSRGFTLLEIIVVIAIIGVLSTIIVVALGGVRIKARDTKRKAELAQIGRFLSATNCYLPATGAGDYDLADLLAEVKTKYPQASALGLPTDPKTGTAAKTQYHYLVDTADRCILYANLENNDEKITLPTIQIPSVGTGTGILRSNGIGINGTNIFYQYSK